MNIILDINKVIAFLIENNSVKFRQTNIAGRAAVDILTQDGIEITRFGLVNDIDVITLNSKIKLLNKYYENKIHIEEIIIKCQK